MCVYKLILNLVSKVLEAVIMNFLVPDWSVEHKLQAIYSHLVRIFRTMSIFKCPDPVLWWDIPSDLLILSAVSSFLDLEIEPVSCKFVLLTNEMLIVWNEIYCILICGYHVTRVRKLYQVYCFHVSQGHISLVHCIYYIPEIIINLIISHSFKYNLVHALESAITFPRTCLMHPSMPWEPFSHSSIVHAGEFFSVTTGALILYLLLV